MNKVVFAIGAHPDDIEFCMAGTLLLLRRAGWELHCWHLARGDCGSSHQSAAATQRVRRAEAHAAARLLGAHYHEAFLDDLEIFYEDATLRRVAAGVREVKPSVILTHALEDYMEDHMNTARLVMTAAFARGMPNYRTRPTRRATDQPVTLYHALPHGLCDRLRNRVLPGAWVNTASVHHEKRAALACHRSQQEWLDVSQGMGSYLRALDEISAAVARMSRRFQHAEGWTRHSHLGFCGPDEDPLKEALGKCYLVNQQFERERVLA
jgi:LmbE family N-acetylglucosaminyl deacetylase